MVAPMQRSSPRPSIGFSRLLASMAPCTMQSVSQTPNAHVHTRSVHAQRMTCNHPLPRAAMKSTPVSAQIDTRKAPALIKLTLCKLQAALR